MQRFNVLDEYNLWHNGFNFKVVVDQEDIATAPWEWDDGHGKVSEWITRDKAPGGWVLAVDGRSKLLYDFQGSMKRAKEEGWNAKPYDVPGETKNQRAYRAVVADFKRLRGWCRGDWCYTYITVTMVDNASGEYTDSVGMVESDYADEEAKELAKGLIINFYRDRRQAKIDNRFKDAMENAL